MFATNATFPDKGRLIGVVSNTGKSLKIGYRQTKIVGVDVLDGPFPRNVTFAPCGRSKPLPYRMMMYYVGRTVPTTNKIKPALDKKISNPMRENYLFFVLRHDIIYCLLLYA